MRKLLIWVLLGLLWLPAARADYVTWRPDDAQPRVCVTTEEGLSVSEWCAVAVTDAEGVIGEIFFYCRVANGTDQWVVPSARVTLESEDGRTYAYDLWGNVYSYAIAPGRESYMGENLMFQWQWEDNSPCVTLEELVMLTVHMDWELYPEEEGVRLPPEGARASVERLSPRWAGGQLWEMLRVTVMNDSGETYAGLGVSVGAYDAQGRLLYAVDDLISSAQGGLSIPDGSSFVIDMYADSNLGFDVLDYLEQTGCEAVEYRYILWSHEESWL